jgi:hypothetical protein
MTCRWTANTAKSALLSELDSGELSGDDLAIGHIVWLVSHGTTLIQGAIA